MNKNIKDARTGCILSAAAVLISAVNLVISAFSNFSIIILCCMIAIFCSSISFYSSGKKKDKR